MSSLVASFHSARRCYAGWWGRINTCAHSSIPKHCPDKQNIPTGLVVTHICRTNNYLLTEFEALSMRRNFMPGIIILAKSPWLEGVIDPRIETVSIILLNCHAVKLPSLYLFLCQSAWAALSRGQRRFFL